MIIYKVNYNDNTLETVTKVPSLKVNRRIDLHAGKYYTKEALIKHLDPSNIELLISVGILSEIKIEEKIY